MFGFFKRLPSFAGTYWNLSPAARAAVDAAIKECRETGAHAEVGKAYAYPQGRQVCWGYNGSPEGFCTHRGIR